MQTFRDDDNSYLTWLATHSEGYVVNHDHRPKASYLQLHQATCPMISENKGPGAGLTVAYSKTCSDSELRRWARLEVAGELSETCACNG